MQDSEKNYCESRYAKAGDHVSVVDVAGINVGLAICYDLRFPELFRQLCQQGAKIITVPSAFTRVTGAAHWQTLLQARAIENQCYVIGVNRVGDDGNSYSYTGNSAVINFMGEAISTTQEKIESAETANLSLDALNTWREKFPLSMDGDEFEIIP